MHKINKKMLIKDWRVSLFSLFAGLIITFVIWSLTHISFMFTWLIIVALSYPLWKEVAAEAIKKYPCYDMFSAIFSYLIDTYIVDDFDDEVSTIDDEEEDE